MKMEFLWRFSCALSPRSWSVEFELCSCCFRSYFFVYGAAQQNGPTSRDQPAREERRECTINIIADLLLCSLNFCEFSFSNCTRTFCKKSFPIEFLWLFFWSFDVRRPKREREREKSTFSQPNSVVESHLKVNSGIWLRRCTGISNDRVVLITFGRTMLTNMTMILTEGGGEVERMK